MSPPSPLKPAARRKQGGATGIEFAVGFTMFFLVFYSLLCYTLVTLLQQGLTQAAQEGSRAALQVNMTSFKTTQDYLSAATAVARTSIQSAVDWMPAPVKAAVLGTNGITVNMVNPAPTVTINTATGPQTFSVQTLSVSVTIPQSALTSILPVLKLSNKPEDAFPPLPASLTGKSAVRVTPKFP